MQMRLLLRHAIPVGFGENLSVLKDQKAVGVGGVQHLGNRHRFARHWVDEGDLRQIAI